MPTHAPRRREAGYNLVVLVMAIAILNIMVVAMLPLWSTQIRREKEEELIFRGLQYAEAIRIFQNRFQRLPAKLEELVEVKPRCIRQLWKDPMTEDGKWAVIFQGQGAPLVPLPGQPLVPPGQPGQPNGRAGTRQNSPLPSEGDEQPETVATGPIIGVHSRSTKASIETWDGKQEYDQWNFTVNLITGVGATVPLIPGRPQANRGLKLDVRWIGRPFPGLPAGFQPAGGGSVPVTPGSAIQFPGLPGIGVPAPIGRPVGPPGFPGGVPGPPPGGKRQ